MTTRRVSKLSRAAAKAEERREIVARANRQRLAAMLRYMTKHGGKMANGYRWEYLAFHSEVYFCGDVVGVFAQVFDTIPDRDLVKKHLGLTSEEAYTLFYCLPPEGYHMRVNPGTAADFLDDPKAERFHLEA